VIELSIDLVILVVDPAWQRRGVGKTLVQDGIQRAQKDGLPIFLSGSPKGVALYKHLGFEVRAFHELTDAKIPATFFEKTPV
jgi:predicted N-acetyltransferase YhbS